MMIIRFWVSFAVALFEFCIPMFLMGLGGAIFVIGAWLLVRDLSKSGEGLF